MRGGGEKEAAVGLSTLKFINDKARQEEMVKRRRRSGEGRVVGVGEGHHMLFTDVEFANDY